MTKKTFSKSWKSSAQPRRQRKYRYNAPLHIKQKFMHVHLSPELRKKHHLRNIQVRKGDKVKVMRGGFKGKEGKVDRINLKREQVFVVGMERIKKDGTKFLVPLTPSNLLILEMSIDKNRKQKLAAEAKKESIGKEEK